MSQHLSGSVSQVIQQDFGVFITFGGTRVRKDLVQSYQVDNIKRQFPDGTVQNGWGLCVVVSGRAVFTMFASKEDAEREAEKIDWIFKKDALA